jgi:plastocyanin
LKITPFRACVALIAGIAWSPLQAGTIRGTLTLPRAESGPVALQPYAGNANALPAAAPPEMGQPEDAVVYVEGLPAGVAASIPPAANRPSLVQENQAFAPRVLAVAVGTEVDFPNRDAIYHNVFSLSPTQRFDLGKYPRGHSKQVRFGKPGLVHVFCDIHSNMEAFILVLPNAAFARPDAKGGFALPPLPAGEYTLVVWHPDFGEKRQRVTVPSDGDVRVALGL